MNETLEYRQHGTKIIRRDFNTQNRLTEKSLKEFIDALIEKGLISSKIFVQLVKENYKDSAVETKKIIIESVKETVQ